LLSRRPRRRRRRQQLLLLDGGTCVVAVCFCKTTMNNRGESREGNSVVPIHPYISNELLAITEEKKHVRTSSLRARYWVLHAAGDLRLLRRSRRGHRGATVEGGVVAHGASPGDEAGATAVANGDEPRETTTRRLPGFWRSSKRGRVGEMPDQPGWRNDYANCPHWAAGGLSTSQTADGRPHGSF